MGRLGCTHWDRVLESLEARDVAAYAPHVPCREDGPQRTKQMRLFDETGICHESASPINEVLDDA